MDNLDGWMKDISRVELLLERCHETLLTFYSEGKGFFSRPGREVTSIISHAKCIEASFALGRESHGVLFDEEVRSNQFSVFERSRWTTGDSTDEEAYPISVALPAYVNLAAGLNESPIQHWTSMWTRIKTIREAARKICRGTSLHSPGRRDLYLNHAMIIYRVRRALHYVETKLSKDIVGASVRWSSERDFIRRELETDIENLKSYVEKRLYESISMCTAVPSNEDEALQLGFLAYTICEYDDFKNDVLISKAIELALQGVCREGESPRFFYISSDRMISASPFEMLSLIAQMPQTRKALPTYAPIFKWAFDWLLSTQRDYSFRFKGRRRRNSETLSAPVWTAEPWRPFGEPEAWINAQVIEFLRQYYDLLRFSACLSLQQNYDAEYSKPDIGWGKATKSLAWANRIDQDLITGIISSGAPTHSNKLEKASLILFGPPGTAKTTIARSLAWKLQWPFVRLAPHHFAVDGFDSIIRVGQKIFRQLMVMRGCVVLLDEIDELVVARDDETVRFNRMITTSVLPWFQDLRSRAELVFVVATNFIDRFDDAVKRPGRFDYVLPVGPPPAQRYEDLIKTFFKSSWKHIHGNSEPSLDADFLESFAQDTSLAIKSIVVDEEETLLRDRWRVTIGEMKLLCETIGQEMKDKHLSLGDPEVQEAIERQVQRSAEKALIKPSDYRKFLDDWKSYAMPDIKVPRGNSHLYGGRRLNPTGDEWLITVAASKTARIDSTPPGDS